MFLEVYSKKLNWVMGKVSANPSVLLVNSSLDVIYILQTLKNIYRKMENFRLVQFSRNFAVGRDPRKLQSAKYIPGLSKVKAIIRWWSGAVVRASDFGPRGPWFEPWPVHILLRLEQVTFTLLSTG